MPTRKVAEEGKKMSLEKAPPTDSDTADGVFQTTPDDNSNNLKLENEVKVQADGPPDGGTAAWLAVLGAWCCSFNSFGWMNSKPRRPVPKLTCVELFPTPAAIPWWHTTHLVTCRRRRFSELLRIRPSQRLRKQHHCMDPVARDLLALFPGACRRLLV